MKNLILSTFLLLTACTPAPQQVPTFRNKTAPITSIALFDATKFSGSWQVVASYQQQLCALDVALVKPDRLNWAEYKCAGSIDRMEALITGPGRFSPEAGLHKAQSHWVMWVDQSYRTAVIGTPGGEFGMILNRGHDIAADRMKAAREILAWNGYDLAALVLREHD
ncbi:MAG TPA: lipocalin [Rhodobacteraceae bacterium]|jgi:apolipoprotein D and lipocalin family protein|nr:lipocalin [Paracoccaceae bacterium]